MAYADSDAVLSALGELAPAFTESTTPGTGDIDGWLVDVDAELDARFTGSGLTSPLTGAAAAAVKGTVADRAALMALTTRWPGGVGGRQVADLRDELERRIKVADALFESGKHPAQQLADSEIPAGSGGGGDAFWRAESDYGLYGSESVSRALTESPYVQPGVQRGQKL